MRLNLRTFPRFLLYGLSVLLIVAAVFGVQAFAGIRGPGKYSGVVVFDRWDSCFLLSGPYITYVSKEIKEDLRPYRGRSMQVDATEVWQPENPGDALIRKYEILGPAPEPKWTALDGLELIAAADFGFPSKPIFTIEIRNSSASSLLIDASVAAPVLLSDEGREFGPSDDASWAVITRSDLGLAPTAQHQVSVDEKVFRWNYSVDEPIPASKRIELAPGQSFKRRITFRVSPGHYQFMFAYGGGVLEERSIASNAISFDVDASGVAAIRN